MIHDTILSRDCFEFWTVALVFFEILFEKEKGSDFIIIVNGKDMATCANISSVISKMIEEEIPGITINDEILSKAAFMACSSGPILNSGDVYPKRVKERAKAAYMQSKKARSNTARHIDVHIR